MASDAELTGLIVKIKADLTDYQAKLDQMQGQTVKASNNVAKSFDTISSTMAKAGIAMGAYAATAVSSAMAWGSAVNKFAKQTGMGADEASKFLVIAKRVGIDTDTASMMFAKLAKSINTATKEQTTANAEGKKAGDIFTQLGVETLDVNGHMRNSSDIFADVKTQLAGMQNGWQKTAIEMEIFGRTGYQLNGLINMTSAEMKDAIDMAQSLGLILDDKTAPAWAKLSKEINASKGVLSATGITIGNELMPMVKEIINDITSVTKAFTSMNPEVRSAIIEVAKLGGEIGIANTILNRSLGVIGRVTSALGLMEAATITAAGPWIALAGAIAYALTKLNEYQTRDRSWRGKQAVIDDPFAPQEAKDEASATINKTPGDPPPGSVYGPELPPGFRPSIVKDDPFIGGDPNAGSSTTKTKEKTDLQKYIEQLKDVEDILSRQSDLGEINKEQVKSTLEAQLEGLNSVVVDQDEVLDKERAIYDLKSKLRQVERDQIDTAKAKSDRDFAAQVITETQYFEQRKKEIQDEINLESEGSAKRYSAEKALQDLINSNNEKILTRTLSQISVDQAYASANLKIEAEQLRHRQAMDKIGDWQGDTPAKLEAAKVAEKAIIDAQYAIELKAINDNIKAYKLLGETKQKELGDSLDKQKALQQKYNADILALDDNLAERQKQLEQNKIDANNATIAALITGTKSGHDVLKDMWFKFVDQVVAKMFSINAETNIFTQLLGGVFGIGVGSAGGGKGGYNKSDPYMPPPPKREFGGPVKAGQPYIVGEKRAELFVPDTSGTIIPNLNMLNRTVSSIGIGAGSTTSNQTVVVNQTFNGQQDSSVMEQIKESIPYIKAEIRNAMGTEASMRSAVKGAAK